MCGLVGFWEFQARNREQTLAETVERMAAIIEHRGPDSSGVWCDEEIGLALGHRRLSIVDLSPNGHQPMISKSTRFVLSYNGEIYNTDELRKELIAAGYQFRGHSDTEVVLEGCEAWGIEKCCQKLNGMFAFALWDREKNTLHLARDRVGKKPMYWGFHRGVLFFGSQLKSFTAHPQWQPEIDRQALIEYFRFNYISSPLSIFKDIHKVKPGHIVTIDHAQKSHEICFWNFSKIVENNHENRRKISQKDWVEELDFLLRDAVKRRMVAEVPLGAFLSGGIDSSTVVALMQAQSTQPVQTFSIGFKENEYNEAPFALEVAKHLGTNHHELYLQANEALDIIPSIPDWCDEPFADASQIPTFLVSRLARKHVIVSLSGDGGDELFAGYSRYFVGQTIWQKLKWLPSWMRKMSAGGIRCLSPRQWDYIAQLLPNKVKPRLLGDKLHKLANVLNVEDRAEFYQLLVSLWDNPKDLVNCNIYESNTVGAGACPHPLIRPTNFVEHMQYLDTMSYLPDDILAKVDRASMAVSLEARAPLLDHRVVEFAWSLPLDMKIRNNQGKWLLRQVLDRYVPKSLIDRPKMGFGVPIDDWLRGPLREWAEDLLSENSLRAGGLLNPEPIRLRWEDHLSGRRNWQYPLWGVLMFQAWRKRWVL